MMLDPDSIRAAIRAKIVDLAKALDIDAGDITDDDLIPATGYLDSAAVLELVVWYEQTFGLALKQEEINIDNLGSINAMTGFLLARKGGVPRS
jgi:acyl carrier protein